MSEMIPDYLLSEVSQAVASQLGLHFPAERWADLARALAKAAPTLGFKDGQSCARWLLESKSGEKRIESLAGYLTIGETHFFRDEKLFAVLEHELLTEMVASRKDSSRHLRIWSAGCATGEEPYTIAMVLNRMLVDWRGWNVTILATDINRAFLQKASDGVYGQWSFRSVTDSVKERYFKTNGDGFVLSPEIKGMVSFGNLNLAKDPFPLAANGTESMDVIFCRNVLMYFTPDTQRKVLASFYECLVDAGWLIVSPAEACLVTHEHLLPVNRPGVVLFRKQTTAKRPIFNFTPVAQPSTPRALETPATWTPTAHAEPVELLPKPPLRPAVSLNGQTVGPPSVPVTRLETPPKVSERAPFPFEEPVPPEEEPLQSEPGTKRTSSAECEPLGIPDRPSDDAFAPYIEGMELFDDGLYQEAADKFFCILDRDCGQETDRNTAMSLLTKSYANMGKLDDALRWCEKTIAADKLNPCTHYLHGTILHELGRLDDAVRAMTSAVFLDPDFAIAHFALGTLSRQLGRRDESNRHYRTALVVLEAYNGDHVVPGSEGMTAGRMVEIIQAMIDKERPNGRT